MEHLGFIVEIVLERPSPCTNQNLPSTAPDVEMSGITGLIQVPLTPYQGEE
jgi:hypothetical protein